MSTTVKVALFPLVEGSDLYDPENKTTKVLKECFDVVAEQDGYLANWIGAQIEHPEMMVGIWKLDSVESHYAWMKTEKFKKNREKVAPCFANNNGSIYHVDFAASDGFAQAMAAPVTEMATFYFDGEVPSDYLEGAEKFCQGTGLPPSAMGVSYEELGYEGGKGKALVLLVGWPTVEKHQAFRETQAFKDHIPLLRNGVKKSKMTHVMFAQWS